MFRRLFFANLTVFCTTVLLAQPTTKSTAVPHVVRMNGTFHPANGSTPGPVESVIFSIYSQETGGAPLWHETQNVTVDNEGRYSALLGSTRNEGLPQELFSSTEPRWLSVQFQHAGEVEPPRVLLASVPYALKAADADTLGGRPASSYMINPAAEASDLAAASTGVPGTGTSGSPRAVKATPLFASTGTTNNIPVFTDAAGDIGNSVLYQSNGKIGLGTTTPADYVHVAFSDTTGVFTGIAVQNLANSPTSYSGMLFYDQSGTLGQFQGFNNSTHEYRINNIAPNGSINFMLGTSKFLVASNGNVGIGSTTPAARLHVLGSSDVPQLRITGNSTQTSNYFDILNSSGTTGVRAAPGTNNINFAVLNDTLGVRNAADNAWLGFIDAAGNISGTGTLNMAGTGNSSFAGNVGIGTTTPGAPLDVTGNVRASGMFISGSGSATTPAITFNGNTNTGIFSSASNSVSIATNGTSQLTVTSTGDVDLPGSIRKNGTLFLHNIGTQNLGAGLGALASNTGSANTAVGFQALSNNTTGIRNTAVGNTAGTANTTGSQNTFVGYNAQGTAGLTNATAIGANAQATQSNAVILGSGANVGIGTTAPSVKLNVVDNTNFVIEKLETTSTVGTWLELNNTGAGGHNWAMLSSGSANGEGAGNLVLIDETGGGSVYIDNPVRILAGSASTPGLTFQGNNNTGIFSTATNTFSIATNGTGRLTVGSTGDVDIPGSLKKSGTLFLHNIGTQNLGVGLSALNGNSGVSNTAVGDHALANNTTGLQNTAIGATAGTSNTTENGNTFLGFNAQGATGTVNATAVGANSKVTASNALVLGSLTDFNNNPTDIFVGIGTTAPLVKLNVVETDSNVFRTGRFEGSSTTGTWLELVNKSAGGHTWGFISASTSNGEGAGNLVISDETGGGKVVMNTTLQVPSCSGCTVAPSDRNLKSNLAAVDGRSVLDRLAGIPVQTWNYTSDPATVRHMGPMAQDFYAAYGLGADDKHINILDEGGVALAAIQELYRANQQLTKRVEELDRPTYNGNVVTDQNGNATVQLPDALEPFTGDVRYQLTVIGQFAQAIVSEEIHGNQFKIKTDKPNVKVSWQVTGMRHESTQMTAFAAGAERR